MRDESGIGLVEMAVVLTIVVAFGMAKAFGAVALLGWLSRGLR